MGNSLNLMALNCFYKPALGWVDVPETIENEGGDSFMQKHIYMGVFPMCPFPDNDHSIAPYVDKYYLDYGNLLNMMKGREWVLSPDVINVPANDAKANIFKVDSGYIIPVVYGEKSSVNVELKGVGNIYMCEVFYPGEEKSKQLSIKNNNESMSISVPLKRGCAMLHIKE